MRNLGIFISPNPLSDKYPSVSPYAYCANNPVMLVDPNGREWVNPKEGQRLTKLVENRIKYLVNRNVRLRKRNTTIRTTSKIKENIDMISILNTSLNDLKEISVHKDKFKLGYVMSSAGRHYVSKGKDGVISRPLKSTIVDFEFLLSRFKFA